MYVIATIYKILSEIETEFIHRDGTNTHLIATIYKIWSVIETEFIHRDGTNTHLIERMADY